MTRTMIRILSQKMRFLHLIFFFIYLHCFRNSTLLVTVPYLHSYPFYNNASQTFSRLSRILNLNFQEYLIILFSESLYIITYFFHTLLLYFIFQVPRTQPHSPLPHSENPRRGSSGSSQYNHTLPSSLPEVPLLPFRE